jgi:hypothetical protein
MVTPMVAVAVVVPRRIFSVFLLVVFAPLV